MGLHCTPSPILNGILRYATEECHNNAIMDEISPGLKKSIKSRNAIECFIIT